MAAPLLLVVGSLAAIAWMNRTPAEPLPELPDVDVSTTKKMIMRDFHDMGIPLDLYKTAQLDTVNLNNAWKPRSAPDQVPTRSLYRLLETTSDTETYLDKYAFGFYIRAEDGYIPCSRPEANPQTIELPGGGWTSTLKGDDKKTLQYQPLAYRDWHRWNPVQFANPTNGKVFNGNVGAPTEFQTDLGQPTSAPINNNRNPYGPSRATFVNIPRARSERDSRNRFINRTQFLAPVHSRYQNAKYRNI